MRSFVFAFLLFPALASFGDEVSALRREIAAVRRSIDSLAALEGDLVAKLDALEREVWLRGELLDLLAAREDSLQRAVEAMTDSAALKRKKWMFHKRKLEAVLRKLYVFGRTSEVELLFSTDDPGALAEGIAYLSAVTKARQRVISDARRALLEYRRAAKALLRAKDSLRALRQAKVAERDSLARVASEHRRSLAEARRSKEGFERLLAGLEASLSRLESMLPSRRVGRGFVRLRGRLPCPLGRRGCSVARPFGVARDGRYGTYFKNPGVDFRAQPGDSVFAVADGKVASVVWLPGFKRVVIIEHGGYYTVYGNLGTAFVSAGEQVSAGDAIGRVASSSWLGGSPALHFEIRRGKFGEDPMAWLER